MPRRSVKYIELILKSPIIGLGEEGEIKKVRKGYAKNYLIPKSLAVEKTSYHFNKLQKEMESILKRRQIREKEFLSLKEKIEITHLKFQERASQNGLLFGSISQSVIFNALHKEIGADLDLNHINKGNIKLQKPIKKAGIYSIDCQIYKNHFAKIHLEIEDLAKIEMEKLKREEDEKKEIAKALEQKKEEASKREEEKIEMDSGKEDKDLKQEKK